MYRRVTPSVLIVTSLSMFSACGSCQTEQPQGEPNALDMARLDMKPAEMSGEPDLTAGPHDMASEDMKPERVEFGLSNRPNNTTCLAGPRPSAPDGVELERAFADVALSWLVGLYQPPHDANVWYAVQQDGVIKRFAATPPHDPVIALDMSSVVRFDRELGLLGMAMHPDFGQNRRVFISYNYLLDGKPRTRISELTAREDGTFDARTERELLDFEQPYNNHNGGMIDFGPDGFLYIAMGDGGSAGDPLNSGQDTETLLGAMLRIDVDAMSDGKPYAIPADNPFVGGGGAPELYAWGLRNPWKFSFDSRTGELWAADVGQNAEEEVDLIVRGGNYGWKIREGSLCFRSHPDCEREDLIEPVVTYPREQGRSITGGYVYHGDAIPGLAGQYVYGDFASGRMWAIDHDPATGAPTPKVLIESTGLSISSFAQDRATGEVFVIHYGPRAAESAEVYKLVARESGEPVIPGPPALLSQTGCFDAAAPTLPAGGLIPYEPKAPFWSDGASKKRWIALPDDATITYANKRFEFPPGTVLAKQFERGGEVFETRLFMRHDDGSWAGYSYAWEPDGSDARLLRSGELRELGSGPWRYPSRGDCMGCHNDAAGFVLGFSPEQLSGHELLYPNRSIAEQLGTLEHVGVFADGSGADEASGALVDPFDETASLDARARSYLHTNCSSCHVRGGVARGDLSFDLFAQAPARPGCGEPAELGALGVDGGLLIAPGQPERSVLLERMRRTDSEAMPASAGLVKDSDGVALIESWIRQMESCD